MAKIEDIGWGMYQNYEGPFYKGKIKFQLPSNPTNTDKCLAAITAIESGHYDAINMYDRMIISVGLIQWGEANTYSVSKFLGSLADAGHEPLIQECLKPALNISNATFKKNSKGNWRFFINDSEVNSLALQQKLFLNCDGLKGKWTPENRTYAKTWAVAMSTLLENPKVCEAQKKFTMNRLQGFVMAEPRKTLFDDTFSSPWAEATRAIYLTFAINLPSVAGKMFTQTVFSGEKWSPEWCLCLIKKLACGPGIKIYSTRYNALRPVIENLFGIELPKTFADLEKWIAPQKLMTAETKSVPVLSGSINTLNPELIKELNEIVTTNPQTSMKPVASMRTGFMSTLWTYIGRLFSALFRSI